MNYLLVDIIATVILPQRYRQHIQLSILCCVETTTVKMSIIDLFCCVKPRNCWYSRLLLTLSSKPPQDTSTLCLMIRSHSPVLIQLCNNLSLKVGCSCYATGIQYVHVHVVVHMCFGPCLCLFMCLCMWTCRWSKGGACIPSGWDNVGGRGVEC